MILAAELDPNQTIVVLGSIIVAVIGLYGVMIANGRRIKVVQKEVTTGNGGTLGEYAEGIAKKMERLAVESDERWKVTLQTAETVAKVHGNQVTALSAAQDLMKDMAAMRAAQHATDQRLGALENHTTRELSELRAIVNVLSGRVDPPGK